jgi:hypothetical protein
MNVKSNKREKKTKEWRTTEVETSGTNKGIYIKVSKGEKV